MNIILSLLDSYWPILFIIAVTICMYLYWKRLTTKIGIILMIAGVAMQFLNMITYGLWGIDIDIFGAMIFIIGLIIVVIVKVREWRGKGRKRKKA
jgi:Na+/proline symporter